MLGDGATALDHGPPPQHAGTVGGTHHGAAHDGGEPDLLGQAAEVHELLRLDPAVNWVVQLGGAQVLGDGEDVAARLHQGGHGRLDLVAGLAHAQDEIGLGDQPCLGGGRDDVETALVGEGRPDPLEDARDRLQVVAENLGARGEDVLKRVGVSLEVGDEQLDTGARRELVHLAGGLGVEPGATVGTVVAGHPGDGGVAQVHLLDRDRHTPGLIDVVLGGAAGGDVAEVAASGAHLAAHQESGLTVIPALVDVGAVRLGTHRVQALLPHQAADLLVGVGDDGAGAQPVGLGLNGGLGIARLNPQELTSLRGHGGAHVYLSSLTTVLRGV